MKINIENYLYQIDQSLAEKKDTEVKLLLVMVAAPWIILSYIFLFDSSEASYTNAKAVSEDLQKKINIDQSYLTSHPESMIAQIENQTKALEQQFIAYQDSNAYIKYQIEQISSLYYDEQSWGEFVDSIAYNAKRYNIKLHEYTNSFAENKDAFGHVLDINVKSKGAFHNTLKYINSLEQSFLVVDIHHLTLDAEDRLASDLDISVWGITY